jgi:predicted PurR-regulated permease PerM
MPPAIEEPQGAVRVVESKGPPKSKFEDANLFHRLGTFVLIIVALNYGAPVLIPLALAVLLTFILVPVVTRMERHKLGRLPSVLIIALVGLCIVSSLAWMTIRVAGKLTADWPVYRTTLRDKSRGLMQWDQQIESYRDEVGRTLDGKSMDEDSSPTSKANYPEAQAAQSAGESRSILDWGPDYAQRIAVPLTKALLVTVLLTFMLFHWEDLRDRFISLIGTSRAEVARGTVGEAVHRLSQFLLTQSIINVLFGVTAGVGLWVVHLVWGGHATATDSITAGLLCGIFRFIPFIGVWIGASVPLAFTFAAYASNLPFFVTLTMFVGLEFFTSQMIEPEWLGASAGICPTAVLVAAIFWTWLWGPIGLILSTPLTALLVIVGKHVPGLRYFQILLADKPDLKRSANITSSSPRAPVTDVSASRPTIPADLNRIPTPTGDRGK